jgi:hypothetical protein
MADVTWPFPQVLPQAANPRLDCELGLYSFFHDAISLNNCIFGDIAVTRESPRRLVCVCLVLDCVLSQQSVSQGFDRHRNQFRMVVKMLHDFPSESLTAPYLLLTLAVRGSMVADAAQVGLSVSVMT